MCVCVCWEVVMEFVVFVFENCVRGGGGGKECVSIVKE